MYLGMVLILIGLAITCKNIIAVGIALIFFLILHFMFIPFEEIKLEKTFGENYLAYKQRVRRWL